MRFGFFLSTAWGNLRKNARFFIPRILCEVGLIGVFFIVFTLKSDERILSLRGGDYLAFCMIIGTVVMMLLSAILIFYTNSFLMKQRKREFGLYNVLGMEKRHIGRVLLHESLSVSLISLAFGLFFGVLLYKLCTLLIFKLLGTDVVFGFDFLKISNLFRTALFFFALDALAFLGNLLSLYRMKPVELMASRSVGEKEPKTKWVLLILGVLSLGTGYGISLSVKDPLSALLLFFLAVILVIVGTYCLFVSGTVFVLKALRKNKLFYYRRNHLPAVSGLLYRMKQNAVGLASICILSTGVLVMLSTTVSLYAGAQDTIHARYPADLYLDASYDTDKGETVSVPASELKAALLSFTDANGIEIASAVGTKLLDVTYVLGKDSLSPYSYQTGTDSSRTLAAMIITAEEYSRLSGREMKLSSRELCLVPLSVSIAGMRIRSDTLTLGGTEYSVRYEDVFPVENRMVSAVTCYGIVVPDDETFDRLDAEQKLLNGKDSSTVCEFLAVTFRDSRSAASFGTEMNAALWDFLPEYLASRSDYRGGYRLGFDSVWDAEESILGMYASLLFLGIILGTVCLFATVLIVYYKQISEGFEDRGRFQIMKKIGMSDAEVKQAVNSQLLTVFFLPLLMAGVHLLFAFPILVKMLHVLLLTEDSLFALCALVTFGIFALIYTCIYSATAKTYCKIVA